MLQKKPILIFRFAELIIIICLHRATILKREEALEMLKEKSLDETTIKNEFEFVARKLDISSDQLNYYFNLPKKFYWDYPNQYQIINFGAKILNKFGSELTLKR